MMTRRSIFKAIGGVICLPFVGHAAKAATHLRCHECKGVGMVSDRPTTSEVIDGTIHITAWCHTCPSCFGEGYVRV